MANEIRHLELSRDQLEDLIAHHPITDLSPWTVHEDEVISFVRGMSEKICLAHKVLAQIETTFLEGGFSSYLSAWFYRPTIDFAVSKPTGRSQEFVGLLILFSAFSPYYVVMQSEHCWDTKGPSGSEMPAFAMVDQINHPSVAQLLPPIQEDFDKHSLIRLSQHAVGDYLPRDLTLDTFLSKPPYRVFDALFHVSD